MTGDECVQTFPNYLEQLEQCLKKEVKAAIKKQLVLVRATLFGTDFTLSKEVSLTSCQI